MIVNVWVVAQTPAVGVNVYIVVCVSSNAGDHIPAIPFKEIEGNAVKVSPIQIEATAANPGVTFGVTDTVIVADVPHTPAVGVKI